MAIRLKKEIDNSGIYGDYWRIVYFTPLDFEKQGWTNEVGLGLYVDESLRQAGKSPQEIRHITLGGDFWNQKVGKLALKDLLRAEAYKYVRRAGGTEGESPTEPFFREGIDV